MRDDNQKVEGKTMTNPITEDMKGVLLLPDAIDLARHGLDEAERWRAEGREADAIQMLLGVSRMLETSATHEHMRRRLKANGER